MVAILFLLSIGSCAPNACSNDEELVEAEVLHLVGPAGPAAAEAEERLVRRGSTVIAVVETGLYEADLAGRLRVVRVLARIGDPEALPILDHLSRHDPVEELREAASRAAVTMRGERAPR